MTKVSKKERALSNGRVFFSSRQPQAWLLLWLAVEILRQYAYHLMSVPLSTEAKRAMFRAKHRSVASAISPPPPVDPEYFDGPRTSSAVGAVAALQSDRQGGGRHRSASFDNNIPAELPGTERHRSDPHTFFVCSELYRLKT